MWNWFVDKPTRLFWTAGAVALILWVAWAFLGIWISQRLVAANIAESGQWGDTFGALNALFGAFGFAAIFATLVLQQGEISGQRKRLDASAKAQHIERFEGSFFQLLGLMRELRTEIRFTHSEAYNSRPNTLRSSEVFIGSHALRAIEDEVTYWVSMVPDAPREKIAEMYESTVHVRAENTLSPFFRIVYTILRRISEDKVLTVEEKSAYGNLVRAQITTSELTIAGMNGLHNVSANFAKFLTEFRMFKYLPSGVIKTALARFYPLDAFEGRD
jgi:hypothetical protein